MIDRVVGSYKILAKVGDGGMGSVYRGWNRSGVSFMFPTVEPSNDSRERSVGTPAFPQPSTRRMEPTIRASFATAEEDSHTPLKRPNRRKTQGNPLPMLSLYIKSKRR
jgi:hypothetical protein